ncbi:hypothetical protein ACN4EG_20875 [Alkalinema pantanalense CENA528]|uniref:hypothetical protein n=1 Tax=Alkalinema pantanalense TaxID=1620705 RepID=UPI003D6E52EB
MTKTRIAIALPLTTILYLTEIRERLEHRADPRDVAAIGLAAIGLVATPTNFPDFVYFRSQEIRLCHRFLSIMQ